MTLQLIGKPFQRNVKRLYNLLLYTDCTKLVSLKGLLGNLSFSFLEVGFHFAYALTERDKEFQVKVTLNQKVKLVITSGLDSVVDG